MENQKLTDDMREKLIALAIQARQNAYAPYSDYPVGAALLAASGAIYQGANVENAVYNMGMCAERAAIFSAVTAGEREFTAMGLVTANGGTPCGACRQVEAEFSPDMLILIAEEGGRILQEITVRELLPDAFGSKDLSTK